MVDERLVTHLKEFGFIKLLRKDFIKADSIHYIFYLPDLENLKKTTEVNLSQFTMFIGALKPFIKRSNKYVEFVGSW